MARCCLYETLLDIEENLLEIGNFSQEEAADGLRQVQQKLDSFETPNNYK